MSAARRATCEPDTERMCVVPEAEKPSLMESVTPPWSPSTIALKSVDASVRIDDFAFRVSAWRREYRRASGGHALFPRRYILSGGAYATASSPFNRTYAPQS